MRRILNISSWPIAGKISAVLLLAALVPLAVAVALSAGASREALERSSRENLQLIAKVTAARLDQLIVDAERMVQLLSRDEALVEACAGNEVSRARIRASLMRRLAAVTETNRDFASIFVTDERGIGLAGTNPKNVGQDFTFREYFRRAVAGENYVSDVLVGKTTHEPGVYFSAPVRERVDGSAEGKVVGVVVLKMRGERIWELVDEVKVGERGYAALVDADGVVIALPVKTRLYHSLGPIGVERQKEIDPVATFSVEKIEDLGLPGLMGPMTDTSGTGSVVYEVPTGEGEREGWVAGYSRMRERRWKVVATEPKAQFVESLVALARRQAAVGVGVACLAGLLALWVGRSVSRPVVALTGAAEKLAGGDLTARVPEFGADELGTLARSFNAMIPKLQDHVNLQRALAVAKEVQQSLLPESDPETRTMDIAGKSLYCDATGGDYYDFIDVSRRDGRILLAVGDVMGHGVGAALLMAAARAALRSFATDTPDLGKLLTKVNRVLSEDARHHSFVTLGLVELDTLTRAVRWASAGHDPAIVHHADDGSFEELQGESGIPLGLEPEFEYTANERVCLRAGDVVVLGTDGIWETRSESREFFGKDRLREAVRAAGAEGAAAVAARVETDLRAFRGAGPQEDDVTMVVARVLLVGG